MVREGDAVDLLLCIDRDGSMVPFHALGQRLLETTVEARLRQTECYYFCNWPHEWLFHDPGHRDASPVDEVLGRIDPGHTSLAVFSDAGAARGGYSQRRIDATRQFFERASQKATQFCWLNPVPKSRWQDTSAEKIAEFLPMVELVSSGMEAGGGGPHSFGRPPRQPGLAVGGRQAMSDDSAARRVEAFRQRHGEQHCLLAMHAAFPLALTPGWLYQCWASFSADIHNEKLDIPWIAVADILLSGLCRPAGFELYQMDRAVQELLLHNLQDDPRFGAERLKDLCAFTIEYYRDGLSSNDYYLRAYALEHKTTALARIKQDIPHEKPCR